MFARAKQIKILVKQILKLTFYKNWIAQVEISSILLDSLAENCYDL